MMFTASLYMLGHVNTHKCMYYVFTYKRLFSSHHKYGDHCDWVLEWDSEIWLYCECSMGQVMETSKYVCGWKMTKEITSLELSLNKW